MLFAVHCGIYGTNENAYETEAKFRGLLSASDSFVEMDNFWILESDNNIEWWSKKIQDIVGVNPVHTFFITEITGMDWSGFISSKTRYWLQQRNGGNEINLK